MKHETFRVYRYGRPGAHWFEVKLFPTKEAMHAYYAETEEDREKDWLGMCRGFTVLNEKGHLTKCCGEILLCWQHCTVGIISHECVHAAFRIAENQYKRFCFDLKSEPGRASEEEEAVCHVAGDFTRQIFNWYYKHGTRLTEKWGEPSNK